MKKLLLLLIAVAVLVAGCTQAPYGEGNNNTGGNPPPANGNAVAIKNFAFSPQAITISVGDTVTWTNEDSVTHTITADPGQAGVSGLASAGIATGSTYSFTFQTAGTWTYHCSIHPSMKGTVTVQ